MNEITIISTSLPLFFLHSSLYFSLVPSYLILCYLFHLHFLSSLLPLALTFYVLFHPFITLPHLCLITLLFCRVWEVKTGEVLNTLIHHNEAVLHLRFANGLMVTCSKDRSIAVWDMASPTDISLRRVLVGHRAAVNVVDFDDKYIVSASGDRTIKVKFIKTHQAHLRHFPWFQTKDLRIFCSLVLLLFRIELKYSEISAISQT